MRKSRNLPSPVRIHKEVHQIPALGIEHLLKGEISRVAPVHRFHYVVAYLGEFCLPAIIVINNSGCGGGFRFDDVVLFFAHADGFAQVVVESKVYALNIWQICGDVVACYFDKSVLHVFRVDKLDVIDDIHVFKKHSADKSVEIASGHKSEFLISHI